MAKTLEKEKIYTDSICSLCSKPIPVDFMENGSTWDGGHTTWPILGVDTNDKANGRCCLQCNTTEVLPARLVKMLIRQGTKNKTPIKGLLPYIEAVVKRETNRQFSYGNTWEVSHVTS